MEYLVEISERAERDLAVLFQAVRADDSVAALNWYEALRKSILSLRANPNRCSRTPESARLRHLLHGRKPNVYRVIYKVNEKRKQVQILHIRHAARREFTKL